MIQGSVLQRISGTEERNKQASEKAKNELTQQKILSHFFGKRKDIIKAIEIQEDLQVQFYIRDNPLSLTDYIYGLIEHDLHHKNQMDISLN